MFNRILIIEDSKDKYEKIRNYILTILPDIEIVLRMSYNSGVLEIKRNNYDLLLLDMTLPTFDIAEFESGGEPRSFGGIDIIKQMKRYKKELKTIVITQFEHFGQENKNLGDLENMLLSLKDSNFVALIYYGTTSDKWKKKLRDELEKLELLQC